MPCVNRKVLFFFRLVRELKQVERKSPELPQGILRFRRRPTLPHSCPCSTIGAIELNFRVRDGNGCDLNAIATEKPVDRFSRKDSGLDASSALSRKSPSLKKYSWFEHGYCGQASRPISTGQLHALLHFHIQPIYLVVFKGSSGDLRHGISHLEVGFPLRCFQRLSVPNVATLHYRWRDNRTTIGSSIPVLSY